MKSERWRGSEKNAVVETTEIHSKTDSGIITTRKIKSLIIRMTLDKNIIDIKYG